MTAAAAISEDITPAGGNTLKQHVWGLRYIDELVQVGVNTDPAGLLGSGGDQLIDQVYYALTDANHNVAGLVDATGKLAERYEYTPYGERKVFTSAGDNDPGCYTPLHDSKRLTVAGQTVAWGINDIGHQGLMHDAEISLIYNRARMLHPGLAAFLQRDPLAHLQSASAYALSSGNPINYFDPSGLVRVKLEFHAFIPKNVGGVTPIVNAPNTTVGWFKEPDPLNFGNKIRFAATDNRSSAAQAGTSRLSTALPEFDSADIGRLSPKLPDGWYKANPAGESHQIAAEWDGASYVYVSGSQRSAQATPFSTGGIVESTCHVEFVVTASGSYPLAPVAPSIDYYVTFTVRRYSKDDVRITISGTHDAFPAYYAKVNDYVVYQRRPTDPGPGILNLGWTSVNFKTREIRLY